MSKVVVLNQSIYSHFPSREDWINEKVLRDGELQVYTDGSKTANGTGVGVFIEELHIRKSVKIRNSCTVFQAEILAMKAAADCLLHESVRNRNISLYVDSQAAIKALGNNIVSSKLVRECRNAVCDVARSNSVRICWVPGHVDIAGNEEADRLAKDGSDNMALPISSEALPPLSYGKKLIDEHLRKEWRDSWISSDGYTISKLFWPEVNDRKTRDFLCSSKIRTSSLIRIFTGHCLLGKHAKIIGVAATDDCRFCDDIACREDIIHLLSECPALVARRLRTLGHPYIEPEHICSLTVIELITFIKGISNLKEIFPFTG